MKMKACIAAVLAAVSLVSASGAFAQDAPAASSAPAVTAPAEPSVSTKIAKMRGKILYRKNQIRKLEQGACAANAELSQKVAELERERRAQYSAAESRLREQYAELDALEAEMQQLKQQATASK